VFVAVSGASLTNYTCHWDIYTDRKASPVSRQWRNSKYPGSRCYILGSVT